MKTKEFTTFVFLIAVAIGYAQDAQVSAGDEGSGAGGSSSYSVGIAVYTSISGDSGWVNQGIQQAYDEVLTTSIDPIVSGIDFSVYPNPTLNFVNLKTSELSSGNIRYAVIDESGKQVMSDLVKETITHIPLHTLSSGIYFVKVWNEKQELQSFKIFKHE